MGIETSVANRKGKEFWESDKEKGHDPILKPFPSPKANTNTRGKKGRRGQLKESAVRPVQKLYDTCKEVFSSSAPGIVPSADKIEKLRAVLDGIKPEDVGLSSEMRYFRSPGPGRTPAIRYMHLHDCDEFSIGIFCFPPSGVIPLHNHPGMTVFSKLLFGKLHIKSYDWVPGIPRNDSEVKQPEGLQFGQHEVQEPESIKPDMQKPETEQPATQEPKIKQSKDVQQDENDQPEAKLKQPEVKQALPVRLAKVKINSEFTAPCNPTILYPADGGNMHRFTAITACAVLDVLGPPYSDPDGRHCTYYYDFPYSRFSVDRVALGEEEKESHEWLIEKGMQSEEFAVVGELYRGPKIIKS